MSAGIKVESSGPATLYREDAGDVEPSRAADPSQHTNTGCELARDSKRERGEGDAIRNLIKGDPT